MRLTPKIAATKGKLALAEVALNKTKVCLSVGDHPFCDFTCLESVGFEKLELFHANSYGVLMKLKPEHRLELAADGKRFDLQALLNLGLAKSKKGFIELPVRAAVGTQATVHVGEFSFTLRFTEPQKIDSSVALPAGSYARATLRGLDWRFVTIVCITFPASLLFGNFLYGLPTPAPTQKPSTDMTFRFSKIVVPNEVISIDESAPPPASGGGTGGGGGGGVATGGSGRAVPGGRELLNERVDSLLSRIDSSLGNKLSGATGGTGSSTGTGTGTGGLGSGLGGGAQLGNTTGPVRRLYNYETLPGIGEKKLANISPETAAVTAAPTRGSLDRGSANMVLRNAYGQIRACYEEALRLDKGMTGKLGLNFTIDAAGRAGDVGIEASDKLQNQGFQLCIKRIIAGLSFPPSSGGATPIKFSMVFTPNDR